MYSSFSLYFYFNIKRRIFLQTAALAEWKAEERRSEWQWDEKLFVWLLGRCMYDRNGIFFLNSFLTLEYTRSYAHMFLAWRNTTPFLLNLVRNYANWKPLLCPKANKRPLGANSVKTSGAATSASRSWYFGIRASCILCLEQQQNFVQVQNATKFVIVIVCSSAFYFFYRLHLHLLFVFLLRFLLFDTRKLQL